MPDKQSSIATYAVGASLAAITLVYVFGPTFIIDGDSGAGRKKGVVGLTNPANDCFINSVLQSLAGLGDLRVYLIRETHRRKLDGPDVYAQLVRDPARENLSAEKIAGLQSGLATQGLKDILDALNERPLHRKTISATPFVTCLEQAFRQRISRQQQDAQEFFQVVAERLMDEYHAGHRARKYKRNHQETDEISENIRLVQLTAGDVAGGAPDSNAVPTIIESQPTPEPQVNGAASALTVGELPEDDLQDKDQGEGFPMEGGSESQIECLTCGFKPKPTTTTFCSLTLSVPHANSTLSSMFDQMFKTEYIEDFKCEKCRLVHALDVLQQEHDKSTSEKFKAKTQRSIDKLTYAIETDPEGDIHDVELPDMKFAPKRKIAKHVQITRFPKVLAVHLSRSIFDAGRSTTKNVAKVSFPERLPLGGLLNQRKYKLSSTVCHKGSHSSGHYESFRRQNVPFPYSTPNAFQGSEIYSKPPTPNPSQISTPLIPALQKPHDQSPDSTLSSTPELLSPMSANSTSSLPDTTGRRSGESSRNSTKPLGPVSALQDAETSSQKSRRSTAGSLTSRLRGKTPSSKLATESADNLESPKSKTENIRNSVSDVVRGKKRRTTSNRWWRISDEKVKETNTSSVLGMQKEVYLLFYELVREDETIV